MNGGHKLVLCGGILTRAKVQVGPRWGYVEENFKKEKPPEGGLEQTNHKDRQLLLL